MNICIFGSGAIGSYVVALLHKNKINVFIQGRKETTKFYIEKYGDSFKRIGKNGWGVL